MSDAVPANLAPVNPVKAKLAAGGIALGLGVRLARSAEIARIARATGHDRSEEHTSELQSR